MGLNINNLKISPTGKRIDCHVKRSGFLSDNLEIDMRIISREVMPDNLIYDFINQVVDRQSEWKQGGVNKFLSLNGINANAYIIKIY